MSARQQIKEGRKALPLDLIAQAVPMLTRFELAAITERLIERLDELSGDPDLEDDDADAEHDGAEEEQGYACAHYQIDQTIMTPPLMSRQPVFEDTIL